MGIRVSFTALLFSCALQIAVLAEDKERVDLIPAFISETLHLSAENAGKTETSSQIPQDEYHSVTTSKDRLPGFSAVEDNTNPPFPSQSSPFWQHEVDETFRDYEEEEETGPAEPVVTTDAEEDQTLLEDYTNSRSTGNTHGTDRRPNIILIITDDQDVELGSMEYMPETLKIFRDQGVEFRHGYVSTPICCPSRSSMLTGLYVHNHEVFTNNDNCSSIIWREKFEKKTFAAYLRSSGYYTSYIGKYLNKYDGSHIPHGWDEWNALLMNSRYYNYTLNRNGKRIRYGHDLEQDYYPDAIARDGLDFLERVSTDPNKQPFLLVLSFPSPHGPEDSAPKYSNLFLNATPHHTPSYNFAPNLDKQWILRVTDKMTPTLKDFTNLLMTKRLQTLQSVDIGVRDIFRKLEAVGLRDSTYALYTSDHGYHVGQFGLLKGKSMPYEFDIRVPFFLTGPKSMVQGGTVIYEPVLNIDITPTFLDFANITIPENMDGRSMLPLIKKYCPSCSNDEPLEWPDVFLIESPGRRNPPSNSGSGEVIEKHVRRLQKSRMREKVVFDDDDNLCALHPHPCLPGQKKYCRKEKNRVRFRKCRQNIDFLVSTRLISQSQDLRINDPLYGHNSSLMETSNLKCSCRFKRSTIVEENVEEEAGSTLDWEAERRRIDNEIEKLKQRIEFLRQRRKEMRKKWLADSNYPIRSSLGGMDGGIRQRARQERKHRKGNDNPSLIPSLDENESPREGDYEMSNESEELVREDKDEDSLEEDSDSDNIPRVIIDHGFKTDDLVFTSEGDRVKLEEELLENESPPIQIRNNSEPVIEVLNASSINTPISVLNPIQENNEQEVESRLETPATTTSTTSTRRPASQNRGRNKHHNRNKLKGSYLFNRHPDPTVEEDDINCNCYNDPRWLRQKEKEDRRHRKILSRIRKKQRLFKRIEDPLERQQAETCGKEEKMNCFWHDNDHWRTAPFWTSGSFCFCMNANNNSYSCLRSVNTTHNYLYCQFITGFKMYFDLKQDPFQLKNTIDTLPSTSEDWIMARLYKLQQCKGKAECWSDDNNTEDAIHPSLWEQIFGRPPKKRRRGGKRRKDDGT